MTLRYEDIYSAFLAKVETYDWLHLDDTIAYETMNEYLKAVASLPYVRARFESISFDDETMEVEFELTNSVDEMSDTYYVKNIVFAQGMVMFWLEPKVQTDLLMEYAVYGKEEKVFSPSGHLTSISEVYNNARRLHQKLMREHSYWNVDLDGDISGT